MSRKTKINALFIFGIILSLITLVLLNYRAITVLEIKGNIFSFIVANIASFYTLISCVIVLYRGKIAAENENKSIEWKSALRILAGAILGLIIYAYQIH